MAGHSHWAGIKHKKEVTDQKRGKIFSKLCAAITAAARTESNPDFNPRLRTAILKARENKVPNENIERALSRAKEKGLALEEPLYEAYGPGGSAILIEVVTDNKNRTVQEIKKIINELHGKWAEPGSVQWAFERGVEGWKAKFSQEVADEDKKKLEELILGLEEQDDVQKVHTNAK